MANITLRNFTINPLELIKVQRFEAKKVQTGDAISNITGAIGNLLNATTSQNHKFVADGEPLKSSDVQVRVEPFKANRTDIRTADPDREVVRLTFKADNHRYELDIPSEDSRSSTLKKLDGGSQELTAVYVPTGAFIAIYSSARLDAWMRELHDDWPLTVLSIPGTHNSPTCHTALPSVRCQSVSVPEQLRNGVRFLDIRCSADPEDPNLTLVHSAFPISLTGNKHLGDMLDDIYKFLDENPSETIIFSLKREGTGKGNDEQMSKHFKFNYVEKKRDKWYTEPWIPTLGKARGRIVIMRRYALDDSLKSSWEGKGWGIDARAWPDNCEDGKIGDGHIRVQDFYEITESQNIEKKIEFARGQLERAAEQNFKIGEQNQRQPPFFVNFLSASNFFNASCWPERIAAKVNPAIVEYLCIKHGEEGQGPHKLKVGTAGTGIVVTDWVGANGDWDLIRCIVGMNARLQHRP
jgi:1-phosphatidylinositol phosphodiesterase